MAIRRQLKFGMHAPRQSLDMTPEKILDKAACPAYDVLGGDNYAL